MVNRHRGEIGAELDGKPWTLCLTLGALAELESAFHVEDISSLATHFSSGKLCSRDMLQIISAGLRGAGHTVSDEDVAEMQISGGALGYAQLVTELLQATFPSANDQTSVVK